jgi:hypothetical protein
MSTALSLFAKLQKAALGNPLFSPDVRSNAAFSFGQNSDGSGFYVKNDFK